MGKRGINGVVMKTYRTIRPLLVEATRCTSQTTIATDMGEKVAKKGDWVIVGEDHELYVVDDAFFQRTFAPIEWKREYEGKSYGC
jgi:hypothetical protein